MKKFSIFMLVLFLATALIFPAHAQIKKVAQTGFQFLKIDVSPRAAGMGGAYTMIGDDAAAMFYNPAGIAYFDGDVDVFVSRIEWIADISFNAVAAVKSFGNLGTFGVTFINSDYGQIIGTRVTSTEKGFEETGDVDIGEFAIGVSYGRQLTHKFSIGGSVRYAHQQLGENLVSDGSTVKNDINGLSYDFGTIFYPGFKSFRLGMSVRNFSQEFKYQETGFQLPLTFRIGFAMDVLDFMGEDHANQLLVSVDAIHPRDYTERINVGAEYTFMNTFALRGGYRFNYDEEDLTAGVGLNLNAGVVGVKIDYSYGNFGVFDTVNRFSVGFAF